MANIEFIWIQNVSSFMANIEAVKLLEHFTDINIKFETSVTVAFD